MVPGRDCREEAYVEFLAKPSDWMPVERVDGSECEIDSAPCETLRRRQGIKIELVVVVWTCPQL